MVRLKTLSRADLYSFPRTIPYPPDIQDQVAPPEFARLYGSFMQAVDEAMESQDLQLALLQNATLKATFAALQHRAFFYCNSLVYMEESIAHAGERLLAFQESLLRLSRVDHTDLLRHVDNVTAEREQFQSSYEFLASQARTAQSRISNLEAQLATAQATSLKYKRYYLAVVKAGEDDISDPSPSTSTDNTLLVPPPTPVTEPSTTSPTPPSSQIDPSPDPIHSTFTPAQREELRSLFRQQRSQSSSEMHSSPSP